MAPGNCNVTTNMKRCITGAEAERLYKARRFRKLVGIEHEATPSDIKAACRNALLQHHPDKGGNEEVFKWIRPATEILLLTENLCTFDYGIPSWAVIQLKRLAELRRDIATSASHLETARDKMATAWSDTTRLSARRGVLLSERGLSDLRSNLTDYLKRFQDRYADHMLLERLRREEAAARDAKAAAEYVILKRRYQRVVVALRQRHRGERKRFPTMPGAVTDVSARIKLGVIRANFLKVVSKTRKRIKQGSATAELESESNELLLEAHSLVDGCCDCVHAYVASDGGRFPVLPGLDPRAPALAKLNIEQRRISNCIKGNTPDAERNAMHQRWQCYLAKP